MKAGKNQWYCCLCWELPYHAQSFDFGSFLLVVSVEMIGMLLNVMHGQVKANMTLAPYNYGF